MALEGTVPIALLGGPPVRESYLPFGVPCLGEEEIAEVVDTLRSRWIGTGPKAQRFEAAFREYIGCQHATAVSSCTAALHLSLVVAGVGPGDEVITSPMTFASTANVIIHQGATPVFADIDLQTLNIDPARIEEQITARTRAIIPVHFGGLPCDMDAILNIARRHDLVVIEDAAHAVGTRYRGRMVGTLGDLTCFSFYANKNLTTAEGGMVTTSHADFAEAMEVYRLHGQSRDAWQRYKVKHLVLAETVYPGYKYNMTDLQASLGLHQLAKLERFQAIRERYAAIFDAAFRDRPEVSFQVRSTGPGDRHALHLYVLLLDLDQLAADRDEVLAALRAENIGATWHYKAVHLHPYYRQQFGYHEGTFPHAEHVSARILSLPLTPSMSEQDVEDVIQAVNKVLDHYRHSVNSMIAGDLEHVPCNLCSANDAEPFLQLDGWPVVRCRACGLAYVDPRPSMAAIRASYGEDAGPAGWTAQYLEQYRQRVAVDEFKLGEYVARIERYCPPGRILDVGCATGAFLRAARARGWDVCGVDLGGWAVEFAREADLDVRVGTLEEVHFPADSFDVVFSKSLLEHVPDPRGTLLEMRRILKDEGLLVVAGVPNVRSFTIRLGRDLFSGNKPPAHLYYFDPQTLRAMVESSGFRCLELRSWGLPNDFFAGLLGRAGSSTQLDQVDQSLQVLDGQSGGLKGIAYRWARPPINFLLDLWKAGAVVEVYAVKASKITVEQ